MQVATDHGHNIRKHALAGETDADVVLVPTEWANELIAAERADKATLIPIGSVRIGAVARADAPPPDVSSMEALRRALASADTVLLTLTPTGDHLMKVIERLGLAESVARKLKRFDTATLLNQHLADNPEKGALGFGLATEILAWRGKGVAWVGRSLRKSRSCYPTPPSCSATRRPIRRAGCWPFLPPRRRARTFSTAASNSSRSKRVTGPFHSTARACRESKAQVG